MTLTKEQIMTAAMELNPADRETLAEQLLLSLTSAERDAIDQAWLAEAYRRDADFRSGKTGAKPVDVVVDRIAHKVRNVTALLLDEAESKLEAAFVGT